MEINAVYIFNCLANLIITYHPQDVYFYLASWDEYVVFSRAI